MFAPPQHGIPLLLKDGRTHSFVSISAPIPGLPPYALTITNGRDGIGPSPGRRKDEKTGSHQMAILTTLFRSVASRARTSRHLSARVPITTGPCTHLDLPQRAAAGSGQVLIRADLDDRVSRLGWRPNWPRLSGMLQHYQRNPFQSNGRPRDEFGVLKCQREVPL